MTFHNKADQAFALLLAFAQELLGGGFDALFVRAYFDLCDGLDVYSDTLRRVEILRRGYVEGHQLQGELLGALVQGNDKMRAAGDNSGAARAIYDKGLVRADFTKQASNRLDDDNHHNDDCNNANAKKKNGIHTVLLLLQILAHD
ncbi:MAG: hypothetical protein NVS3B14_17760 [Ktedonobacteraceae bacterium]